MTREEGLYGGAKYKKIHSFPLPPSIIIKTRKSLHTYWLVKDGQVGLFRDIQKGLVRYFDGDPMCVNESRVMRLPGFNHCKGEPVEVQCVLFHPERRYTQEEILRAVPHEEKPLDKKTGTEQGLELVVNGCEFIRHCKDDSKDLPEAQWYAMITNLAPFEGGTELIHQYSSGYEKYSEAETQKKINHYLESGTRPMTCQAIAERGWTCPRLKECGCKAPAAMCYKPLDTKALCDIVAGLPITGSLDDDIDTAMGFVKKYLYNQESPKASVIIGGKLKEKFHFKTDTVKELITLYKKASKEYGQSLDSGAREERLSLPPWYEPGPRCLRFLPGLLANHLAENANAFSQAKTFYFYDGGVYHEVDDDHVDNFVRSHMIAKEAKTAQITDTVRQWRMVIRKNDNEVNANPYIINLQNGLYNVLEDKLTEHTPKYLSTIQLPVSYTPGAQCPRFIQYLHEVLPEEQIPLIQEMMGYFLIPVTRAQKSFLMVGAGGAGKSQLLLVLNELLLGKENVSNVSWQAFNERFKPAELYGKLANIFADLPTKNIEDNGIFKALVGEDYITAEKKNKDPFSFQNKARLLFSCNSIPKNYGDKSEGFYRRLIIIRFDHAVPEDKKDPEIQDKFRKEANGIFLFALEGLRRLMRNNYRFSETAANKEELQRYREESDSVLAFVRDCCEVGGGEDTMVASTELYNSYKAYCEECGLKAYAQRNFIMSVLLQNPETSKARDGVSRVRVIKGIKLNLESA